MSTGNGPHRQHEKKRAVVVAGILNGNTSDEIAAAAGCARRTVNKIISEPETQLLVTGLFAPYHKKLRAMAKRVVQVVEQGLSAKHFVKTGKDEYRLHADTFGRLRAVERYGELVQLAQGKAPGEDPHAGEIGRSYTWEEFTLLQARRATIVDAAAPAAAAAETNSAGS